MYSCTAVGSYCKIYWRKILLAHCRSIEAHLVEAHLVICPLPTTGYQLLEPLVIGQSSIVETMGDESVRDINAPGCHRGIVVERAIIQWWKIQTGLDRSGLDRSGLVVWLLLWCVYACVCGR